MKNYKDVEFLCKSPRPKYLGSILIAVDNTTQISIWSNVEAGLGITAGCLTTLRPLFRALRETSSNSRSRSRPPGSIPLSSNMGRGTGYARSKTFDREESRQLWPGTVDDDYHSVMTGKNHKRGMNTSEENLNPRAPLEPEYRVTIRGG